MSILIKNALLVTMNDSREIIDNGEIFIDNDRIAYAGAAGGSGAAGADEVVDAAGKAALPGLINAHTHASMTLFRGYADDMALKEWLETMIWPREAFLTADDVYWGAILAAAEMIKGGTTCFADMYWQPASVAQACLDAGIRASLCGVLLGVLPTADKDLADAAEFVEKWNGAGGLITTMFGPHALYTCQTAHLKEVAAHAKRIGAGVHVHLLETRTERDDIRGLNNSEVLDIFEESGLFDVHVLAAHSVYFNEEEKKAFKAHSVYPVHCPGSNLKLASGIAPVPEYLKEGLPVGLGADGTASNNNLDMFEEIRLAALIHKASHFDPTLVNARQALELATLGSAQAVGLPEEVGQLKAGMKADVILVDIEQPHMKPLHNIEANLVYSASAGDVSHTIINGKMLMKDRQLVYIDEAEIIKKASEAAYALMRRS